jgi:hypothetical protein
LTHLQRTGYAFDRDTMTRPADSPNLKLLTQRQALADGRAQQSPEALRASDAG